MQWIDTKRGVAAPNLLDRRTVLTGMAALASVRPAAAEGDSSVARGVLAQNPLALAFGSAPSNLPDVTIVGPNGERDIDEFKGRTLLMPLWAEWCAPCLSEIPDFARLQAKFGNSKFAIVPILTGPQKQMTPQVIAEVFTFLHASVFEPLIEKHFGNKLMLAMARKGMEVTIPCNLLIAPDGHVVGRQFGAQRDNEQSQMLAGDPKQINGENSLIARAESGDVLSLWGKPPGEEFAAAMADGFLTQS
jgi:thiol-disulfide isomerase/thioredoxin